MSERMTKKRKRRGHYDGRPGAMARANKLTPERRKEIAQKAAASRWAKRPLASGSV